ncbi:rhamnose transport system ATP-binding protein [Actinoalloteichus hoggarensis]|uniref:Ribose import ATP-binding protein RbsA n=1 Tax=Actinoalloteichus hoggarensis TaxID=1470176 RepID=A0A221W9Y0_9PSEU|nr:sugar ABC transporter ATP-binding protein [Actinoalloteichus hoggarensis]ASO22534.1 Ribose import ATP-binding protein RbsA [Actinoalloteichus hoggarensis]MBB5923042.1 rhamnose transport system ATP-binding protein [Actinoalloteichus hoggarensis]
MADQEGSVGSAPLLSLRGVSKSYGAVHALRGVELDLYGGEVHALAGENGAGKSTLVKILAGVHAPDTGELLLDGTPHPLADTAAGRAAGIAVIYQEPTLFPDLSVAENIFMGRQPTTRLGRIDHRAVRRSCEQLFARLGVRLDPDRPARGLSIADQQMVEIAKALSFDARVLVMDEPTSALSGVEVERLFGVVRALRDSGAAVLFISHRFDEIFALCSRVTVLRDGRWVSTDAAEDLSVDTVIRRMVGREVATLFPKTEAPVRDVVLEVTGLSRAGVFHDVDLKVRGGEIVALAGLVGAGRSEVVRAIFGIDRYDAGSVRVAGRTLRPGSPAAAMAAGIALVPEDRRQQGLVMELSVERNATLTRLWRLARFGWLSGRGERAHAEHWSQRLQVKADRLSDPVATLSGGNQQKVVLAKWLATEPAVLIVDEPTRGIDVGTKSEVHRLLSELAGEGMAVIMVSSELPEVLGMADRVLVMHEGRLVADIPRGRADENSVMAAATGGQDTP